MDTVSNLLNQATRLFEKKFPKHNFKWRDKRGKSIFGLCPSHDDSNPSFNIYYKFGKIRFKCFSCDFHGTLDEIDASILGFEGVSDSSEEIIRISKEYNEAFTPLSMLPESELKKMAIRYIESRGLTQADIFKYRIGLGVKQGKYFSYIGFPFLDDDYNVHFFCARSFVGGGLRYLFPKDTSKVNKNCIYFSEDTDTIVLVEGVFDALKVAKAGFTVMALLGKYLSQEQLEYIKESGFSNVTLFLDKDALDDAQKLKRYCEKNELDVVIAQPTLKDPGDMTPEDIRTVLLNSNNSVLDIVNMYLRK